MHWYRGPTLLGHLETVDVGRERGERPFRFPVQWVNRPHLDFRGYAGTVASGSDHARRGGGDPSVGQARPCGPRSSPPTAISTKRPQGDAVTLTFAEEVDVSRGDIIARAARRAVDRRSGGGADRLVRRGADAARPRLYVEMRLPDHDRDRLRPQIQAQCRQSRPRRRQDARAQRGRAMQPQHRQGAGVRSLCRERRHRLASF